MIFGGLIGAYIVLVKGMIVSAGNRLNLPVLNTSTHHRSTSAGRFQFPCRILAEVHPLH